MINVTVKGREIQATPTRQITSGSVGLPVSFNFTDDWDDIQKIAVFKGSDTAIDVALFNNSCVVPAEVLANAGDNLWVGIYGANQAGTIVIPTIWGKCGHIFDGTEPSGVDPSEPTPSWVAQVQAAAAGAVETAEAVAAAAAAGDFDGEDGVSPTVEIVSKTGVWSGGSPLAPVSNSRSGFALQITDANGTQTTGDVMEAWPLVIKSSKSGGTTTVKLYTSSSTADATLTIKDGDKGDTGAAGADGEDGTDGVSPTISSSNITGGHRLTIVDADGTTTVDVMDGTDGTDGVSPTVTVTNITGGHAVKITDADHPSGQTFNVMDGTNGTDGDDGTDGTTFTPAVSNAGVISWTNDGNKQNPASVDIVAAVLAALPIWNGGNY